MYPCPTRAGTAHPLSHYCENREAEHLHMTGAAVTTRYLPLQIPEPHVKFPLGLCKGGANATTAQSAASAFDVNARLTPVTMTASRRCSHNTGVQCRNGRGLSGGLMLRTRLPPKPRQRLAGLTRRAHAGRELDAGRVCAMQQVAAVGIDAAHPPVPRRALGKLGGIELDS